MNITDMNKVNDVNKRSATTPDLKYSDNTERWTMNEDVQSYLNLGEENGLVMYIAVDEDTEEQVVLIQIVDSEEADFFKGKGNIFTARRLADAVDNTQFMLSPVDDMENTYALRDWDGESEVLDSMIPDNDTQENVGDQLNEFMESEDDLNDEEQTSFA